ncbi:MAG: tRNA preQ1(34) S-adenosylmethionine ribosyltransferase-isomerase QueA [Labilithrix sp.]|nr:tRNA preQ1(34) S-adenosylmethionine ribosyltransferase-isomerase QueA [Labilithrix sp.]MCW5816070.1 tRNA preQ1(34) S-adenosylmethionine ribosyltransferase-isomerase QueA [Labilithrix sp.]
MRASAFAYDLPPELIAQEPAPERDAARLMVVGDALEHARIAELASFVPRGSLVVVNDTKVIRARIVGTKESGGKAEVFLVRRLADGTWQAMTKASKPMRPGTRVTSGPLVVTIEGREPNDGLFLVRLAATSGTLDEALAAGARMPLPPYIKRTPTEADEARYQTVFAKTDGAVAAPTAGLHLTEALLARLRDERGCEVDACTLHVGLGTFQPVTTEDLDDHAMHSEPFVVTPSLAASVARARERGAPVLAIGTTVVRALESAATEGGHVRACAEETRILIQPGYRFRVVDRLLTNFHLPESTLLALVSAFAGTERVLAAYRAAVAARYRFFSYGDAMLLSRAEAA